MVARPLAYTDIADVETWTANVKAYGAVGDGTTDDSAAILAAVNAAAGATPFAAARRTIYFPTGVYRVTQSAVLTPTITDHGSGLKYFGDGRMNSIIRLDMTGASADKYIYDNVSTARMQLASFVDLGFQGLSSAALVDINSISNFAKGFRLNATTATGSHEQNFQFTRCMFTQFNIAISLEGDNTASENSWVQCDFANIKNNVLVINNPQSLNNMFIDTNFTSIYGDMFLINSGGGAITVYGGSVILADKPSASADTWFLNIVGSVGPGAQPLLFDGIRMELRGAHNCLLKMTAFCQCDVTFANCNLLDQGTGTKADWVSINSYGSVLFQACMFYEMAGTPMRFKITNASGPFGQNGSVVFDSCALNPDWSDRCSYTSWSGGQFSARDCRGANVGAPTTGWHHAIDFDSKYDEVTPGLFTGWAVGGALPGFGSPVDGNFREKKVQLKFTYEWWNEPFFLRLPRNAIITSIKLLKPAGGSTATVATLNVSRQDKTGTPHLTSNSAAANTALQGVVNDYYYNVGTTNNERNLALYFSTTIASSVPGGLAIVTYI